MDNFSPNTRTISLDRASPNQRGFTLIEIIVVVAIIGVMVLAIGLNLSRDTDRLAGFEAKRFISIVGEVRDEAIISGQSYFLIMNPKLSRYSFKSATGQAIDTSNSSLFGARELEAGVDVEWEVFEALEEDDEQEEQRVLITSLGEITPFEARFSGTDSLFAISLDDKNRLVQSQKRR